ncbi:MAG: hypothetical protein U0904_01505 [Candidatus Nanopelagicales bacterium]|nr:hypothetical protein [Candidatus Nanopelagicales bacterium]
MTSIGVPLTDLSTRATPEGVVVSTSAQRWLADLPDIDPRRDGSGTLLDEAVADIGGSVS